MKRDAVLYACAVLRLQDLNKQETMTQRTQACLAFPLSVCLFLTIPLAILTPIIFHLEPTVLEQLDSMADVVFTTFSYGNQPSSATTTTTTTGDSSSTGSSTTSDATTATFDPEDVTVFHPGQVFTHRRYRYQGVLTSVLTKEEIKKLTLKTTDDVVWYHALVDMRYKKGGATDHVQHEDVNIVYPGESNIKHPDLESYFNGFNKETSSYLSSSSSTKRKKKNQKEKKMKEKKKKIKKKTKQGSSTRTTSP